MRHEWRRRHRRSTRFQPRTSFGPARFAELFSPDAWSDDDPRYYLPLGEGVGSKPLWISLQQERVVRHLRAAEHAGMLQRHYHPQDVFGFCLSGRWRYLEHDWARTPGTFVYEAPGESHTLVVEESGETMKTLFHVNGPLIWLDEAGEPSGVYDAYTLTEALRCALRRGRHRRRLRRHADPLTVHGSRHGSSIATTCSVVWTSPKNMATLSSDARCAASVIVALASSTMTTR